MMFDYREKESEGMRQKQRYADDPEEDWLKQSCYATAGDDFLLAFMIFVS
jgi:hypothetical protein